MSNVHVISLALCMHKIHMEEGYKASAQHQRRLNLLMKDVLRKEVIKWLDAGIMYPKSDSIWVSPTHCVPKKGGIKFLTNQKNEFTPSKNNDGWRICMDYRKLNDATRKENYAVHFIDQTLEKLSCQEYNCFMDGYLGYNQIVITQED